LFHLRHVDFGDFSHCMSDFANLDPLLVADEFNVGRLIPALANIVTAVRGAGLGDLAQEILSATQTCGIGIFPAEEWIEGQDENEPTGQVGRLGVHSHHQAPRNSHAISIACKCPQRDSGQWAPKREIAGLHPFLISPTELGSPRKVLAGRLFS
jgi:hypothetical protein